MARGYFNSFKTLREMIHNCHKLKPNQVEHPSETWTAMETWTFTFADMSSFPILREMANRNVLLRNDGGFTFTNVTEQSGIDVHMRLSFQSLWWDFNQDGHQDVLVINDKDGANSMFENKEMALSSMSPQTLALTL